MSNFEGTTAHRRRVDSALGLSTNKNNNVNTAAFASGNNSNNSPAAATLSPSSRTRAPTPNFPPRYNPAENPPAYAPTPNNAAQPSFTTAPPGTVTTLPSSAVRPRIAVLLGLSTKWQLLLFACRLVSIVPGVFYGLPSVLRLLAMIHLLTFGQVAEDHSQSLSKGQNMFAFAFGRIPSSVTSSCSAPPTSASPSFDVAFETRLRLTETLLATIWCGTSSYLSFFFTDSLMSRWLLNYTPIGTIIRLLAINAINGYATSWVLYLTGASEDPRLLLPSWILISTTLTVLYHVVHAKINIRKETRASISAFSIASFISMVALLAQLHSGRSGYGNIPLAHVINMLSDAAFRLALRIMEYGNVI
ncbi:N-glycosylation protein-domain-containing protein [Cladorrhinum samala]|uniref:N-glycosylation protein-domain-containing protein n=1 Tax=Cladorrhinum samala TaxID=585594 RepID=A0AAV9I2P0_9PEZI|nr:N-glycosylation protein-domain-containing protein [Cladorrhinum samala]